MGPADRAQWCGRRRHRRYSAAPAAERLL